MPRNYSGYEAARDIITYYVYTGPPNNQTVNTVDGVGASGFTSERRRTFVGAKLPNYKAFQKANGYLPTLSASDRIVSFKALPRDVYYYFTGTEKIIRIEHRLTKTAGYDPGYQPGNILAIVSSKLRQKVISQDFNAPVFLAEAGKTVDMIAKTATRLANAYRSLRRGDLKNVALMLGLSKRTGTRFDRNLKKPLTESEAHNIWLEIKYGWTPLLMDVHGAAVALARSNFDLGQPAFYATEKSSRSINTGLFQGSEEYTAKAWVRVRITNPNNVQANRLGGLNPLLVAWELVPFSFVADWFVNIGDYLQELTAFAGLSILDGGYSITQQINGTVFETVKNPYDTKMGTFEYRRFDRSPTIGFPLTLRVKSDPLNISKVITAAALLKQVGKF